MPTEQRKKWNTEYRKRNKEKFQEYDKKRWLDKKEKYGFKDRGHRKPLSEWISSYKDKKLRARDLLVRAVRLKRISKPLECSQCKKKYNNKRSIQGHHEDYDKPFEIIWLCPSCHYKFHPQNKGEMKQYHKDRKRNDKGQFISIQQGD